MDLTGTFRSVVKASRLLSLTDPSVITDTLLILADEAERHEDLILSENIKDLDLMDKSDPRYDRLLLDHHRIQGIATDIRNVAGLANPLGKKLAEYARPNGLRISKVTVPFGVIGIIYESRPNVTFDVFSLCLKSGNACILKGGSDAINSNNAITSVIKQVLEKSGISQDVISLLPAGRSETRQLLNARKYVDLIIPRGSRELIDFVRSNSSIPVIETGAGICHSYFDESGDREKARVIINNAKTRRVSVCNALDCLIIHKNRLEDLGYITGLCADSNVAIYADPKAYEALTG